MRGPALLTPPQRGRREPPAWAVRIEGEGRLLRILVGESDRWHGIGDEGATTSAARGVASPESVADAADSLDAVGNSAQFPPEAANHDVDRVAATVVTRAPYLAK